jgi:hypothetical protein
MAIMEHAYYASFGYQVTSFFAASSRCGNPVNYVFGFSSLDYKKFQGLLMICVTWSIKHIPLD